MINSIIKDINNIYIDSKTYKDKLEKHYFIENQIYKLAVQYNMFGVIEYKIPMSEDRNGKIDVVWKQTNKPHIAFEIDSSLREKSLKKLSLIQCEYKVWICYSKKVNEFIELTKNYNNIIYITPNITY